MIVNEHGTDAEIRANAYGLERRAMSEVWAADDPPSEAEIELSKAISLKRIANNGDRIASALERFDFWEGSLCIRDTRPL